MDWRERGSRLVAINRVECEQQCSLKEIEGAGMDACGLVGYPAHPDSGPKLQEGRTRLPLHSCSKPEADIEDIARFFSQEEANQIKAQLLTWYDTHQRQLPWRSSVENSPLTSFEKAPDTDTDTDTDLQTDRQQKAYATWVSEVMLQQTQVVNVIGYFNRWMERWPTVKALAAATEEEVNALWAGLGYYRRARFLLEGARKIIQDQGGVIPSSAAELQKIPGIGKYTAGAIASIAFGQHVPVVDGNVIRVLCRLKAISDNPKTASTIKILWKDQLSSRIARQASVAATRWVHSLEMQEAGLTSGVRKVYELFLKYRGGNTSLKKAKRSN